MPVRKAHRRDGGSNGDRTPIWDADRTVRELILDVVLPTVVTVRTAMFGLTRGATVGLMAGMRDSMLMVGDRMKLCA